MENALFLKHLFESMEESLDKLEVSIKNKDISKSNSLKILILDLQNQIKKSLENYV